MYSILSPAFMGSAVSAHGWSCNSPLLTTSCFFCLVHCFNPNSGPPQTQWRAQGRYTKCSWASTMISQWHLEKKTAKAFFVGKVAKLAYGCKRASATCYKPPKVHNGTLPLKPVLPTTWPHDHMTTKKDENGWISTSLRTTAASSVNAGPSPLGFEAFELDHWILTVWSGTYISVNALEHSLCNKNRWLVYKENIIHLPGGSQPMKYPIFGLM